MSQPLWRIRTRKGEILTDKTHYPWDVPLELIESVDRIVDGRRFVIIVARWDKEKRDYGPPDVHNVFVKSEASIDYALMGEHPGARPMQLDARIIGFHVGEPPNVYRVELNCFTATGDIVVKVEKVPQATRDGF